VREEWVQLGFSVRELLGYSDTDYPPYFASFFANYRKKILTFMTKEVDWPTNSLSILLSSDIHRSEFSPLYQTLAYENGLVIAQPLKELGSQP